MIGPSDLYRVPACTSPSQSEELLRYARLEHAAANLEWAAPASPAPFPRVVAIREWLAAHLRLPRPAVPDSTAHSLRSGLAAVHFDGEGSLAAERMHSHADSDRPSNLLAASALILTAQPCQPNSDETCTCEH